MLLMPTTDNDDAAGAGDDADAGVVDTVDADDAAGSTDSDANDADNTVDASGAAAITILICTTGEKRS